MAFAREKPEARTAAMVGLRVTADEDRMLGDLAEFLAVRGKADVVREALDFWMENSARARQAIGQIAGKKKRRSK
jgi:hypothetical protein